MLYEIFPALIVCLDTYLTAVVYSNSKIKIPATSALVISLTGAAVLGISLKFSEILSHYISDKICSTAGLIILTSIGITTIFKSLIRCLVRHISDGGAISLKMNGIGLGISIYLDDKAADIDKSKSISISEAAALSLASSLDSAAAGINCGFSGMSPIKAFLLTLAVGFIAIQLGSFTGKKISSARHDFSWVGGILLIIFAVCGYF